MDYDFANFIVSILTITFLIFSIVIAYRNLRSIQIKNEKDDEYRRDKEIVDQCVISLERAYDALAAGKDKSGLPAPNRLNWLTSARMIIRYYTLKKSISSGLYKIICEEQEEYWRHKFYLMLNKGSLDERYFSPELNPSDKNNIDGSSAIVIIGFSKWKKRTIDPIDNLDYEKAIIEDEVLIGYRGLKEYLRIYDRQYRKLIDGEANS